ncbi:hypothetical protein [Methanobrevibacter sp.]|uniref:hypothetical protein n=1 Tax=Methanobrevibacter sp. TaxID=66852 RepID=UPI0025FFED4F|nr:hypothetical protein [Methanobrevibacter sp.]MBQ2831162.1 hypothetical protein [Methanobrevibacter sp.]
MIECKVCGFEIDEDDVFYECPFCGREIDNDGLWSCENCDSILDWEGDEWICPYCSNQGDDEEEDDDEQTCPSCGSSDYEDGYCYECGYPSNLGWVGEQD